MVENNFVLATLEYTRIQVLLFGREQLSSPVGIRKMYVWIRMESRRAASLPSSNVMKWIVTGGRSIYAFSFPRRGHVYLR